MFSTKYLRRGATVKAHATPAAPDAELEQYRRAALAQPGDAQAHAQLGVALQRRGQFALAAASQRQALELDPGMAWLHPVLAAALRALGQNEAAVDSYRRALLAAPGDADLYIGLCDALQRLDRFDEAAANARDALARYPGQAALYLALAAACHAGRDYPGAIAALRDALALAPDHFEAQLDLANLLQRVHRHDEAAQAYRRALALRADHVDAHKGLAASQRHLGQYDAALASYQCALALAPDDPAALRDMGVTLNVLGKVEPALASLQRALAIAPDDALVHGCLGFTYSELGQWELGVHSFRRAVQLDPASAPAHSRLLFALSHCCNDPAELFAEHCAFGARFAAMRPPAPHANPRDPARRLRVGFVSGDFYHHAVATFIEPVFAFLKHSGQLSLHAYYNNTKEDEVTARLRGHIPDWHQVAGLDDDALERKIRADGIDILVDLSGHTPQNRLPLFARKPAPVQASWIGYAGTTGLQAMDYLLADQAYLPAGRYDDQFTEQIVRMPLAAPFLPEPEAPAVNPLPALANGYLTFGSFHRPGKLNRSVIALWARLLRALPAARMVLGGLSPGADTTLLDWFAGEGIDPARLDLRVRTGMTEYLAQHHEIDLCLSPFPYSGATTIGHALWMGVPTLATVGPTNPSHASAWLLAHLGLDAFIAADDATFVKLGVLLSENLGDLAALRAGMRARFLDSPVGYPDVAAAGLEHALRLMWQRWCAGLPPAPLQVGLDDLAAAGDAAPGA